MTRHELEILNDFKSFIDRKIMENDFQSCLITLGQDISNTMVDGVNSQRITTGEHGKIVLALR